MNKWNDSHFIAFTTLLLGSKLQSKAQNQILESSALVKWKPPPVTWVGDNDTCEEFCWYPQVVCTRKQPTEGLDSDQSVWPFFSQGGIKIEGGRRYSFRVFEHFGGNLTIFTSCYFSVNPKWLIAELCVTVYLKGGNLQVSSSSLYIGAISLIHIMVLMSLPWTKEMWNSPPQGCQWMLVISLETYEMVLLWN